MSLAMSNFAEIQSIKSLMSLNNRLIRLTGTEIGSGENLTIGDFTEASYSGYAPVQPDFSEPVTGPDGVAKALSQGLVFEYGANPPGGYNIWGWYMTADDPLTNMAEVVCWEKFAGPYNFLVEGQTLVFFVELRCKNLGGF